jgi:glycosyltransferase involved in cell wall biosynthesis
MKKSPLVSILCLTYNHIKYIEDALDSILNQKVDFDFELIVFDDCSTDGTTEVIKAYAGKYPEIIKPVLQPENLLSKGIGLYRIYTQYLLPLAKHKYIAICEGDDFWSDQAKLQQQVDFLEKNPQYTICFHKVGILKNGQTNYEIYDEYHRRILGNRSEFIFTDLLKDNMIPNCSVVYRNVVQEFPDLFKNLNFPDWPLHLLYAEKGKIGYINKFMAIHREHEKGLWNGSSYADKIKSTLEFYIDLLQYFGNKHQTLVYESMKRYYNEISPEELGKDFKIGFTFGKLTKQKEVDELRSMLKIIQQSGSYRLARRIGRLKRLFVKK